MRPRVEWHSRARDRTAAAGRSSQSSPAHEPAAPGERSPSILYTAEHGEPVFFDPSREGRLNSPDGSYGVLYAAREVFGAFAETFLRRPGRTLIDHGLLRRKAYVRLELTTDVNLIRLAGPSLAILGATAEVVHGGLPYDAPQAWSKALFAHPLRPDGIAYYAR